MYGDFKPALVYLQTFKKLSLDVYVARALINFRPMFPFYTRGKHHKTKVLRCLQGVWNWNIGQKWVNVIAENNIFEK